MEVKPTVVPEMTTTPRVKVCPAGTEVLTRNPTSTETCVEPSSYNQQSWVTEAGIIRLTTDWLRIMMNWPFLLSKVG